jgi:alpha-tubulin suppressor-like RCC1 family protein
VLSGVQAIAAGNNYTCAWMQTGGVRCWGYNTSGQLGDSTLMSRGVSSTDGVLCGVEALGIGSEHTCALMTTGGVRCWGNNFWGQLGLDRPDHRRPTLAEAICR